MIKNGSVNSGMSSSSIVKRDESYDVLSAGRTRYRLNFGRVST